MTGKLYFDNLLIGELSQTNSDFPSCCGDFKLLLNSTDNLSIHILNYIDFSMRQDRYYASFEDAVEYEPEENELDKLEQEENNYVDIVETNSWHIKELNGEKTKILIPTFGFDNSIVWRYNFE